MMSCAGKSEVEGRKFLQLVFFVLMEWQDAIKTLASVKIRLYRNHHITHSHMHTFM